MEVSQYSQFQIRMLLKGDVIRVAAYFLQYVIDHSSDHLNEDDKYRIKYVIDILKVDKGIGSVTKFPLADIISGEVKLDDSKVYVIREKKILSDTKYP
ncbi:hypothetical protein FACS189472_15940 [Alphaproteobacteria bacterium]|nr:hypothetical protein FACS189472_15940 [Alphaproteobacteria bacterium]